jgi:hypothetical protein
MDSHTLPQKPTDCSEETRAQPSSCSLLDAPIGIDTVAR